MIGPLTKEQARALAKFKTIIGQKEAQKFTNQATVYQGLQYTAWTVAHLASIAFAKELAALKAAEGIKLTAAVVYGTGTAAAGGATGKDLGMAGYVAAILYYHDPITGEAIAIGKEMIELSAQ
jgi:hypothetical protein